MKLALTYNVRGPETGGHAVAPDSGGPGGPPHSEGPGGPGGGGKGPLQGLPEDLYAEWDDLETIEAVRAALKERHEDVELIEADTDAYEKFKEFSPELVFNMAEGLSGEGREAHIPAILEMLGIPYTGSGPLTLALCLNKARAKQVLSFLSVPTPGFIVASGPGKCNGKGGGGQTAQDLIKARSMGFPLMVKPLYEGSSKGIRNDSIVNDLGELSAKVDFVNSEYSQPALVEEYLSGREFTVAILGNDDSKAGGVRALPVVEINYSSLPEGVNHIYSYEAKWILDRPDAPLDIFTCPAELDDLLEAEIKGVAIRAFNALEVRDWCRVDVRLSSKGVPNIIELNPLPGILPDPTQNSCFPKAARAEGMDFTALVNAVVENARKRYGI